MLGPSSILCPMRPNRFNVVCGVRHRERSIPIRLSLERNDSSKTPRPLYCLSRTNIGARPLCCRRTPALLWLSRTPGSYCGCGKETRRFRITHSEVDSILLAGGRRRKRILAETAVCGRPDDQGSPTLPSRPNLSPREAPRTFQNNSRNTRRRSGYWSGRPLIALSAAARVAAQSF